MSMASARRAANIALLGCIAVFSALGIAVCAFGDETNPYKVIYPSASPQGWSVVVSTSPTTTVTSAYYVVDGDRFDIALTPGSPYAIVTIGATVSVHISGVPDDGPAACAISVDTGAMPQISGPAQASTTGAVTCDWSND